MNKSKNSDPIAPFILQPDKNVVEERRDVASEILTTAIENLYNTDNLELKTDLTNRQISVYTSGLVFAELTGNDVIKSYIKNMMLLNVSKNRGGRKEFKDIVTGIGRMNNESDITPSVSDRLLGKGL